MQKRIIALAAAGLVSGAAFAQSNVTIYGIADMSYVNYSDANADGVSSTHQINSGQWKTSRFGLKGSEDLGNDLSAIFQMEFAMNMDVNNGPITQRPSWVGLRSKSLGELSAGNFTTLEDQLLVATSTMLEYGTVASPKYVYIETAGSEARNMISNAVHYYSPVWDGFQIKAGISTHASNSDDVSATGLTNNTTTNTGNNRVVAAALHYNKGPLVAGATYEYNKYEDYSGRPSTIKLDSGNTWNLAAAYDFGVARVSVLMAELITQRMAPSQPVKEWITARSGNLAFPPRLRQKTSSRSTTHTLISATTTGNPLGTMIRSASGGSATSTL